MRSVRGGEGIVCLSSFGMLSRALSLIDERACRLKRDPFLFISTRMCDGFNPIANRVSMQEVGFFLFRTNQKVIELNRHTRVLIVTLKLICDGTERGCMCARN